MAKSKYICVKHHYRNRTTLWCGTLQSLIRDVFGHTLECGHSHKPSINANPKSVKSLVSSLNKSYDVCGWSEWAMESTYEEFVANGGVIEEGDDHRWVCIAID